MWPTGSRRSETATASLCWTREKCASTGRTTSYWQRAVSTRSWCVWECVCAGVCGYLRRGFAECAFRVCVSGCVFVCLFALRSGRTRGEWSSACVHGALIEYLRAWGVGSGSYTVHPKHTHTHARTHTHTHFAHAGPAASSGCGRDVGNGPDGRGKLVERCALRPHNVLSLPAFVTFYELFWSLRFGGGAPNPAEGEAKCC